MAVRVVRRDVVHGGEMQITANPVILLHGGQRESCESRMTGRDWMNSSIYCATNGNRSMQSFALRLHAAPPPSLPSAFSLFISVYSGRRHPSHSSSVDFSCMYAVCIHWSVSRWTVDSLSCASSWATLSLDTALINPIQFADIVAYFTAAALNTTTSI